MSQNAERAKAILQIRKLREQTVDQGRTEAEAMLAMDRMAKLFTVYNITMDEVDLRDEPCIKVVLKTGKAKSDALAGVITAIADFCNLICYRAKEYDRDAKGGLQFTARGCIKKEVTYVMFGMESDTQMAQHLYDIISTAVYAETAKFSKNYKSYNVRGAKKSASVSFAKGMVSRLYRRLTDMAREMNKEIVAARGSNSLMVMKDQKVKDEFKKNGVTLRKSYQQTARVSNGHAYSAGHTAGGNVNLNRPITSSSGGGQLLLK